VRYLRYADTIVAISKSLQEALERNGIKDVSVIYNGIDVTEWHVDADTVTHFKTKYALEHKKILLFGGRLSTPKGGAKVIEALAQIVNHEPSTVLLVAGTIDAYARSMQAYAKECGVEQGLVFTGWIDRNEIKIAYASADIVMMPSIYLDAFGRVNIEGMASHKPVIGTCYGGTPEVTLDSVTGYIVNPLHPKEIAEKTIDLLKNPERAKQFGVAGYERVRTQFNLEDKVEEYIEIYTSLTEVKHK
jgi:glycosyltransferase involved in cell wall biosynthesis